MKGSSVPLASSNIGQSGLRHGLNTNKNPFELHIGDLLHMDTPFNRHWEGTVTTVWILNFPCDKPATPCRRALATFPYLEKDSDKTSPWGKEKN